MTYIQNKSIKFQYSVEMKSEEKKLLMSSSYLTLCSSYMECCSRIVVSLFHIHG